MTSHSHPPRDASGWDDPDFCPFCGDRLTDAGAGFLAHVEESPTCKERFDAWRENVADDVGGEWGG